MNIKIIIISLIVFFPINILAIENTQIIIKGSKDVDKEIIQSIINDIEIINTESFDEIIKILYQTGNFKNISLKFDSNKNLVINFQEYQKINSINFSGNERFKNNEILDIFKDQEYFTFYDDEKINQFKKELKILYSTFGYNKINIEYETINLDNNFVDINFKINEGEISKINKVYFVGNNNFNYNILIDQIKSKPRNSLIFFTKRNFKYHIAKSDIGSLYNFYRSNGYKNVSIDMKTEFLDKKNRFNLYYYIDEGKKYSINQININYFQFPITEDQQKNIDSIVSKFSEDNFDKKNVFNILSLEKLSDLLEIYLVNEGYNFFDISLKEKTNLDMVDIILEIKSTKVKYVKSINIFGNFRTLDKVIRREILFAEGDPITDSLIAKTTKQLKRLDIFESIEITEKIISDEFIDLDIVVKEKSTGEFNIGLSVGTFDGATFVTRLKEKNFYGTGRNAEVEINTSSANTLYKLNFTEPFFMNKHLSLSNGLSYSEKDLSSSAAYNVNSFNLNSGISYFLFDDVSHNISLEYDLKDYEVTDSSLVSSNIASSEGTNANFYLVNNIIYNKLNSFLRPTKGNYISYNNTISPITNSKNGILKNHITLKKYLSFSDNSYIFSNQTKIGNVISLQDSEITNDEKFSLGGNWLRGFDTYGVGPRKSKSSYVGGNNILVTKFDLKRSIIKNSDNPIDLNIFTDIGTVYGNKISPLNDDNSIRASYGFGFNFYSPIGPIGFTWGFPIADESYDIKRMFFFSIGNVN